MPISSQLLLWGIVTHLVADWLLQNAWMSDNKTSLLHPAAYAHSGIHLIGFSLLAFVTNAPWYFPVIIAISHLLIDTRVPLQWWSKLIGQTQTGDMVLHVRIWTDQVAHVLMIAIAALIIGGTR